MKIVTIKELWLLPNFILTSQAVYELLGFETLKIGHTHTSGRQRKIKFLNILDYFEYSDTNMSKKIFFMKT